MAKKNRLQSGSYRIQRRYRGDDGKTHLKSFTARSRAEAEAMAAEWEAHRIQVIDRLTVTGPVNEPYNFGGFGLSCIISCNIEQKKRPVTSRAPKEENY